MELVGDLTLVLVAALAGAFLAQYFKQPLIEECLQHLPAALRYPDAFSFQRYLKENLPQNSIKTRERYADSVNTANSNRGDCRGCSLQRTDSTRPHSMESENSNAW